jgi:hypothetical protein
MVILRRADKISLNTKSLGKALTKTKQIVLLSGPARVKEDSILRSLKPMADLDVTVPWQGDSQFLSETNVFSPA